MAMNVQANQHLNIEHILYDVLHIVCKNLPLTDLFNVSKVSKSFRHVALCEKAKRRYIQQFRLPCAFSWSTQNPALDRKLKVEPEIALLIYDYEYIMQDCQLLMRFRNHKLMEGIKTKLPYQVIALQVIKVLSSEDAIFRNTKDESKLPPCNCDGILGLFIPRVKERVHVNAAWADIQQYESNAKCAEYIIEQIGFNTYKHPNSTVLFGLQDDGFSIAKQLEETIRNRFNDGKDTIWGVAFEYNDVKTAHHDQYEGYKSPLQSIMALRITGTNVKSWSTISENSLLPMHKNMKNLVIIDTLDVGKSEVKFIADLP